MCVVYYRKDTEHFYHAFVYSLVMYFNFYSSYMFMHSASFIFLNFIIIVFFIKCCRILNTVQQIKFIKKVQRALENVLAGNFLPPGRGLAPLI